jgi:hypothetical protein
MIWSPWRFFYAIGEENTTEFIGVMGRLKAYVNPERWLSSRPQEGGARARRCQQECWRSYHVSSQ